MSKTVGKDVGEKRTFFSTFHTGTIPKPFGPVSGRHGLEELKEATSSFGLHLNVRLDIIGRGVGGGGCESILASQFQ